MSRNGEGVWGCSWLYCRSLGVPLRLLRARPSSSVSVWSDPCNLSWTRARRQPSLRLQEWKKRAINMQSIIPTGLHALPLLDAQVALCSVAIPLSCSGAFPLCHLSVLKGSSEDPRFSALKRPTLFSPLIPVNLFCPLQGKIKIGILSKNMVSRGRSWNNYSNTKSSLESWRV